MTARALRSEWAPPPDPFGLSGLRSGAVHASEVVVRAMFDPPSAGTMTMVPLAIEIDAHRVRVSGIRGMERRVLQRVELAEWLDKGAARALDLRVPAGPAGPIVGAWIGAEFASRLRAERAPAPGFDVRDLHAIGDDGWLLVDAAPRVFALLELWLREAFAHALERRSEPLAELMLRVMPHREETRAALWWTAPDAVARGRELAWWSRLSRDAGRRFDEEHLMARIHQAADVLWPGDETTYHEMTESSLSGLVGQRGAQTAIAVRCAERLRPLLHFPDDFPRGEHLEASVDRALAAARDAALGRSIADRNAETRERGRLELLEVARAIEEVEPSDKPRGHFHPAIHALEFMQDRGADQAVLSLGEGMIYALYPDDVGTTWALQRRAQSVARRAVAEDIQWLLDRGRVHPRFFERELWPSGSLLGWEATLDRHQAWIDEHWAKRKSAREPVSGV